MSAYTGRDVGVEFAIGLETDNPAGLTFKNLGMMRTKQFDVEWATTDTTADDSPDFTETKLVTFKNVSFTGDGVSYEDAIYNQAELEAHVFSPGVSTLNQPKVWLKITFPDAIFQGPFIISKWGKGASYNEAVTWSMEAMSNGQITRTAA